MPPKLNITVGSEPLTISADYADRTVDLPPLWLRERAPSEDQLDAQTYQRLFNPHMLDTDLHFTSAQLDESGGFLNVAFSDGYRANYPIEKLSFDIGLSDELPKIEVTYADTEHQTVDWNMISDPQVTIKALSIFLARGYLILQNVPTNPDGVIDVGNFFGNVRCTNFGEMFEVKTKPNPNDLAYTSLALDLHTDNPYREPVPGIQLLHCLINETTGGMSTLVDSFAIIEFMRENHPTELKLLEDTVLFFHFKDSQVDFRHQRPLIQKNYDGSYIGVFYSPKLDFMPLLSNDELVAYQKARRLFYSLLSDDIYEKRFKLKNGELMMFDNARMLHGRTSFDTNEGQRWLQGCYIDIEGPRSMWRMCNRNS